MSDIAHKNTAMKAATMKVIANEIQVSELSVSVVVEPSLHVVTVL